MKFRVYQSGQRQFFLKRRIFGLWITMCDHEYDRGGCRVNYVRYFETAEWAMVWAQRNYGKQARSVPSVPKLVKEITV